MGQQPNVRIGLEDLPRATPKPAAARRWSPNRPGDMTSPDMVPWGGAFGTPGPDSGYALSLLRWRDLPTLPGESRRDLETAVMALMVARASHFGRAPVMGDAEVAEAVLGVGDEGAGWRTAWTGGLTHAHRAQRDFLEAVDSGALFGSLAEVRERLAAGERLVADRP